MKQVTDFFGSVLSRSSFAAAGLMAALPVWAHPGHEHTETTHAPGDLTGGLTGLAIAIAVLGLLGGVALLVRTWRTRRRAPHG